MRRKITAEDLGKQINDGRIDGAELKAFAFDRLTLGQAIADLVDQILNSNRIVEQRSSLDRHFHLTATSVKEPNSQLGFQFRNAIADRWLSDMHRIGGAGKGAQFRDSQQVAKI